MKYFFLIIFVFAFSVSPIYGQGKLEKAEESLKTKNNSEFSSGESYNSNNNFFASAFEGFFIDVLYHSVHAIFIESPFEVEHLSNTASITKYPYYNSNKGNYSYEWDESMTNSRITISSRYIYENARIEGTHINMDMSFLKRLALEIDYLQLWENNPNFGDNALALYTILAKYNRVRTEKFDAFWGIGAKYIDGNVNEWGFTYGLGAELFIAKPISIESNFNQTFINNSSINQFNALLNYHVSQYKLSAGYESLKIGSQDFSTISLGLSVSF